MLRSFLVSNAPELAEAGSLEVDYRQAFRSLLQIVMIRQQ